MKGKEGRVECKKGWMKGKKDKKGNKKDDLTRFKQTT